jgi:hypothetical protein
LIGCAGFVPSGNGGFELGAVVALGPVIVALFDE